MIGWPGGVDAEGDERKQTADTEQGSNGIEFHMEVLVARPDFLVNQVPRRPSDKRQSFSDLTRQDFWL
jgi:hypothetical protein